MIKDSLNALADSARATFRGWRGLLLISALYFFLLGSAYEFFSVGVATAWQLIVSGLAAGVVPLLLFVLLAATAHFALPATETTGALARRSLRDFIKVFLFTLPIAGLAWLFVYLLGKLAEHLPKIEEGPRVSVSVTAESKPVPLHWQQSLTSGLWVFLLGIVLPLVAAHLWLSVARDGFVPTLKRVHRVVARAFAPRSLLVYLIGFFVFALVPYFVLYTRTSVTNGWAELLIFGLRLVFAFVLTLWGWTITLGALARVTPPEAQTFEAAPAEAPTTEVPTPALPGPEELPAPPATGEAA